MKTPQEISSILETLKFGERVAEDEEKTLEQYFVKTRHWRKVRNGDTDILLGPKGSGKSAIYSCLLNNADSLREENIEIIAAENLRGTAAFEMLGRIGIDNLEIQDEFTEQERVAYQKLKGIWKLYFLMLVVKKIKTLGFKDKDAKYLVNKLEEVDLLPKEYNLVTYLKKAIGTFFQIFNPANHEPEIVFDPMSGLPTSVKTKINIEDSKKELNDGYVSLDDLIRLADGVLSNNDLTLWIAIDRLDSAFVEDAKLERNALRALFRTYLDFKNLEQVKLKIFIRDDIWDKITDGGFAELSHITKYALIKWDKDSLLNLVVRRLLTNTPFLAAEQLEAASVLADFEVQKAVLYKVIPSSVEDSSAVETFDWLTDHLKDGQELITPREVIHLLNSAVGKELDALNMGKRKQGLSSLLSLNALRVAMKDVAAVKYNQTLLAEYNQLKQFTSSFKFIGLKCNKKELKSAWAEGFFLEDADLEAATADIIEQLCFTGFLREQRKGRLISYEVGNIYKHLFLPDLS